MQTILNIIVFVLVLGVIVFIHELGHFIAAKRFGIYAPEFSIGMGPKLFSKKVGETEYQLRLFPIGGFVVMAGEVGQEDNEQMKDVPFERTLPGISTWKRCVIMLAGIFMNFVLAIVLLVGVYSFAQVPSNDNVVNEVVETGAAKEIGLQSNDEITAITMNGDNYIIETFSDIQNVIMTNEYNKETIEIEVEVLRNNELLTLSGEVDFNSLTSSYQLGITQTAITLSFSDAVSVSLTQFKASFFSVFEVLGSLVTDSANTISQLSGPAGIYTVTADVNESGSFASILCLIALLSINIGVFNLLPIPGLDGCHVLFAIAEKIIGKELPQKLKFMLQLLGLFLVFGLMVIVSINDIIKIFG